MQISIVVPVFNVEQYLGQCVESLLRQRLNDYEIILVNDGSTDDSGSLCDVYAARFDAIRAIHKENGGLSDARNAGLREITGDYVIFVDSDDYLADGALANIEKHLSSSGADVIFLEAKKVFPDGRMIPMGDGYIVQAIDNRSKKEVLQHIAALPKFPGSACTKMIKASLIKEHHLYFEKGLLSEDIDWTVRLLLEAETFSYYSGEYYYYRQGRANSITNASGIKNVMDLLSIIKKWASKDLSHPFQQEINAFMAYEYMVLLYNYAHLGVAAQEHLKEEMKAYRWLLRFGKSKKAKLVNVTVRGAGINMTAKLLSCYKRHRA
ncbi:MAG TPA: glycosyltransferase [Clostridiales bacterium]|nr:glycosyltransferase [Clostridiales bacterium]